MQRPGAGYGLARLGDAKAYLRDRHIRTSQARCSDHRYSLKDKLHQLAGPCGLEGE